MLYGIISDQQSTCISEEKLEKPGYRNLFHFGPALIFLKWVGRKQATIDFIVRMAPCWKSIERKNLREYCAGEISGNFAGVQEE